MRAEATEDHRLYRERSLLDEVESSGNDVVHLRRFLNLIEGINDSSQSYLTCVRESEFHLTVYRQSYRGWKARYGIWRGAAQDFTAIYLKCG